MFLAMEGNQSHESLIVHVCLSKMLSVRTLCYCCPYQHRPYSNQTPCALTNKVKSFAVCWLLVQLRSQHLRWFWGRSLMLLHEATSTTGCYLLSDMFLRYLTPGKPQGLWIFSHSIHMLEAKDENRDSDSSYAFCKNVTRLTVPAIKILLWRPAGKRCFKIWVVLLPWILVILVQEESSVKSWLLKTDEALKCLALS